MDAETLRSFGRQIYGHEIWLDAVEKEGAEISVLGLYGHKMVPDNPMPTDYANVILYDDKGLTDKPDREIISEPHGWKFYFEDKGAEVYTIYIDSNSTWVTDEEGWHRGVKRDFDKVKYSGAFNMLAKRIVSRNGANPGNVVHGALEIMPNRSILEVGKDAKLQILYEGKPKAGIKVVCFRKGDDQLDNRSSDADGMLVYPIKEKGTYMFIAKYTDTDKKVSDEFDETGFTMTLTLEAE